MKWLVIYLLFFAFVGLSQNCQRKYFEVIDTGRCVVVSMSKYVYADLYRDQSTLNAVRDSIPKLIKGVEQERRKALRMDSIRVIQIKANEMLVNDYKEENIDLQVRNHELYNKSETYKRRNRFFQSVSLFELILIMILI